MRLPSRAYPGLLSSAASSTQHAAINSAASSRWHAAKCSTLACSVSFSLATMPGPKKVWILSSLHKKMQQGWSRIHTATLLIRRKLLDCSNSHASPCRFQVRKPRCCSHIPNKNTLQTTLFVEDQATSGSPLVPHLLRHLLLLGGELQHLQAVKVPHRFRCAKVLRPLAHTNWPTTGSHCDAVCIPSGRGTACKHVHTACLSKHAARTRVYWPSTTSSRRPVRMGHSRRGMPPACPNLCQVDEAAGGRS